MIREERCLLSSPHKDAECYLQEVLACSRCAWKIDFTRSDDSETDDDIQSEYGNRYMQIVGALNGLYTIQGDLMCLELKVIYLTIFTFEIYVGLFH